MIPGSLEEYWLPTADRQRHAEPTCPSQPETPLVMGQRQEEGLRFQTLSPCRIRGQGSPAAKAEFSDPEVTLVLQGMGSLSTAPLDPHA